MRHVAWTLTIPRPPTVIGRLWTFVRWFFRPVNTIVSWAMRLTGGFMALAAFVTWGLDTTGVTTDSLSVAVDLLQLIADRLVHIDETLSRILELLERGAGMIE